MSNFSLVACVRADGPIPSVEYICICIKIFHNARSNLFDTVSSRIVYIPQSPADKRKIYDNLARSSRLKLVNPEAEEMAQQNG